MHEVRQVKNCKTCKHLVDDIDCPALTGALGFDYDKWGDNYVRVVEIEDTETFSCSLFEPLE